MGGSVTEACGVVVTTIDDETKAREMARALVAQGLAACVQISAIDSVYRWRGALEEAREYRLEMKMRLSDYAALEAAIRALHPYETPEIALMPIARGYAPYLDWIAATGER